MRGLDIMEKILKVILILTIIFFFIVLGYMIFNEIDKKNGEKIEEEFSCTIIDTDKQTITYGKFPVTRYYIITEIDNKEIKIQVTNSFYNEVNKKDEIVVVKTTIKTKITNKEIIEYSILED